MKRLKVWWCRSVSSKMPSLEVLMFPINQNSYDKPQEALNTEQETKPPKLFFEGRFKHQKDLLLNEKTAYAVFQHVVKHQNEYLKAEPHLFSAFLEAIGTRVNQLKKDTEGVWNFLLSMFSDDRLSQLSEKTQEKEYLEEAVSYINELRFSDPSERVKMRREFESLFSTIVEKKQNRKNLESAIRKGDKELIITLLQNGTEIDSLDENDQTPLFDAIDKGQTEIVELFLRHGASIKSKDKEGRTPLFVACEVGNAEIVKLLIEKGADVDAKNYMGISPLTVATGNEEIVELLIDNGASTED